MLGIALNAQRAGWNSGGPPSFQDRSSVTMVAAGGWSGFVSFTQNSWISPFSGDNLSSSFDNSNIPNGNNCLYAITVKFAEMSNFTWRDDDFRGNYQHLTNSSNMQITPWAIEANNKTVASSLTMAYGRRKTTNLFSPLWSYGTYEYLEMPLTWDNLANRWITIMIAGSATPTDFANANYVQPAFGSPQNFFIRVTIADATTGELLATRDFAVDQFNSYFSNYADYTYDYYQNSSSPNSGFVRSEIGNGDDLDGSSNLLVAAGWGHFGYTVDPLAQGPAAPWYQYLLGQNMPKSLNNNVSAWVNWSAKDVVSDGTNRKASVMLAGRASTTDNVYSNRASNVLTMPYTNSSRPGV